MPEWQAHASATAGAEDVVQFWQAAGPACWFGKQARFDQTFRERFLPLHETVARALPVPQGASHDWLHSATGALALLILLDQFPRHAFRGHARMYATDGLARHVARQALAQGWDQALEPARDGASDPPLRLFFYLPFAHAEDVADQQLSVRLNRPLGQPWLAHAEGHAAIIARFGRFPHRNPLLGRRMTAEEQDFLDQGGFAG